MMRQAERVTRISKRVMWTSKSLTFIPSYLTVVTVTSLLLLNGVPNILAQSKYVASFLEIPVGARALGMGDAYVSLADDGTAFHYNPAGTALINSDVLSMMYSSQYGSLLTPLADFYFAGYAQKIQDLNVSVDWVRLSVDNIPSEPDISELDPAQREYYVKHSSDNGTFGSADDAIYLNISRLYDFDIDFGWLFFKIPVQFPIGINFKYIHRLLSGRAASGIGLDGGFMLRFPIGSKEGSHGFGILSFGMNVRDITNTRIAWDTQTNETIPRSVLWGLSYDLPISFLQGDAVFSFNRDSRYGDLLFGGEYIYDKLLSVRLGSDASNLTAGAGIELSFMRVDYAFLGQSLGNVNRVSASFYLDRILK